MTRLATSRPAGRRGRGFTIVEVLATLMLAAIILPAAARGVLLCLATSSHARRQAQAASLAQSKLADLVAAGDLYDSEMKGDFGKDLEVELALGVRGDDEHEQPDGLPVDRRPLHRLLEPDDGDDYLPGRG